MTHRSFTWGTSSGASASRPSASASIHSVGSVSPFLDLCVRQARGRRGAIIDGANWATRIAAPYIQRTSPVSICDQDYHDDILSSVVDQTFSEILDANKKNGVTSVLMVLRQNSTIHPDVYEYFDEVKCVHRPLYTAFGGLRETLAAHGINFTVVTVDSDVEKPGSDSMRSVDDATVLYFAQELNRRSQPGTWNIMSCDHYRQFSTGGMFDGKLFTITVTHETPDDSIYLGEVTCAVRPPKGHQKSAKELRQELADNCHSMDCERTVPPVSDISTTKCYPEDPDDPRHPHLRRQNELCFHCGASMWNFDRSLCLDCKTKPDVGYFDTH
jgi:hypothetical protein